MVHERIAEKQYEKKTTKKYKFSCIIGLSKSKVRKGLGLKPGIIKGGPKSSSEEIDKVVYGV